MNKEQLCQERGWSLPRLYSFRNWQEVLEAANDLPNLEEGFVMVHRDFGMPVMKVKSQTYVISHRLRGEGLNPKRCMDLVIMNETDEYLTVFPEDVNMLQPYIDAYKTLWGDWGCLIAELSPLDSLSQKEFALKVKDKPQSSLMFSLRKGLTITDAWDKLTQNAKYNMISGFLQGGTYVFR